MKEHSLIFIYLYFVVQIAQVDNILCVFWRVCTVASVHFFWHAVDAEGIGRRLWLSAAWTSWADSVSTCFPYIPALGCVSRRAVETRLVLYCAFLSHEWAQSHHCNKPGNAAPLAHTHLTLVPISEHVYLRLVSPRKLKSQRFYVLCFIHAVIPLSCVF